MNHSILRLAVTAALLCAAAPANAATGLECVLDKLTPAEHETLGKKAFAALTGGDGDLATDADAAFESKARACEAKQKWAPAATVWAVRFTLMRLAMDELGNQLRPTGIDTRQIESYLSRHRELIEVVALTDAQRTALLADLRAAGVMIPAGAEQPALTYMGSWTVLEKARQSFTDS